MFVLKNINRSTSFGNIRRFFEQQQTTIRKLFSRGFNF